MDVSIIIVNYNTCELLKNCIASVYEHTKEIKFEIIVSDNGSKDNSISMLKENFPQVILIENNENLGFGKANNRALKIASGKYIFYLNSDTVIHNNAVKIFFDYWENSINKDEIGALGCNLIGFNKEKMPSCGSFPDYKTEVKERLKQAPKLFIKRIIFALGKTYNKKPDPETNIVFGKVDYVTGADLFLLNNEDAYYDERFFLYFEETDLELQLNKKNKFAYMIDGPQISHLCNVLGQQKNDVELMRSFSHKQYDISCVKYFRKNLKPDKNSLCLGLRFAVFLTWIAARVK